MRHFDTKCVREGYEPKAGEPVVQPIVQSTTFRYDTTEQVHELFDLQAEGYFYSRIENPTVAAVEKKVAALEGGVGALMTSSGQAATTLAILNITEAGDHIIAAESMYGGTINLLRHHISKLGISITFVDNDITEQELEQVFQDNTKLIIAETVSNPVLRMVDISMWAKVAHQNNTPLFIDNTLASAALCNPIKFGADIVIQSSTKYLDGHALQVSGMIVDSGNFDWEAAYNATGKFARLVEPDISYKGLSYTKTYNKNAYIVKSRVQLMRDFGSTPSPFSAFLLSTGIQTLHLRMQRHFESALTIAQYLEQHPKVSAVNFPALKSNQYYELAQKYLPNGVSGVLAFEVKSPSGDSDRENARKVINALQLVNIEVNVAEVRTCALHPATSTHRQLTDDELVAAKIGPGLIRLSVGLENVDDIIADLESALAGI
jgi:OAH/OAS sulfhydrylase